jgi:hypothetical protein
VPPDYSASVILAAGLLVLLGLGLFVAGVASGTVALYWATVAACAVAAVLLILARRPRGAGPDEDLLSAKAARPARSAPPAAPRTDRSSAPSAPGTSAAGTHRGGTDPAPGESSAPVEGPVHAERMSPAAPPAPADEPAPSDVPAPADGRSPVREPAPQASAAVPPPSGPGTNAPAARASDDEPPMEDVEVTDLLIVVDLKDDVYVIDEHPRYHLPVCRHLVGQTAIPLPIDEARTDGFTPCGSCEPDRNLADLARARKAGRST